MGLSRPTRHAIDVLGERGDFLEMIGCRHPYRPFGHALDDRLAAPRLARLAHGDAVAHRLAAFRHMVEKTALGVDDDGSRRFLGFVGHFAPLELVGDLLRFGFGNRKGFARLGKRPGNGSKSGEKRGGQ